MSVKRILIYFLFVTMIGALWVAWGRLIIHIGIPFSWSSILSPIWFLPVFLAARYQQENKINLHGLILISEILPSFISWFAGPFGVLSFHFAIIQGFFGEVAFRQFQSPLLSTVAAACGDALLIYFHPQLLSLRFETDLSWIFHILILFSSTALFFFVFKLGLRKVGRRLLRCSILFVLLSSAYAHDCKAILSHLREKSEGIKFSVVVDFDGTIADTDLFLISEIIPKAIHSLTGIISPSDMAQFEIFLERIHAMGTTHYPETYSESAWTRNSWSFPIHALPKSMTIIDFWKRMRAEFKLARPQALPIILETQQFLEQIHQEFSSQIEWMILTSRTHDELESVLLTLNRADFLRNKFKIISAGKREGKTSIENALYKIENLKNSNITRPILMVENDPTILSQVREEFGSQILLVRIVKSAAGHKVIF